MIAPRAAGITLALLAITLAACTSAPSVPGDAADAGAADASFNIGGRLSASRGTAGSAAVFDWNHEGTRDRIDLASPFGQIYARVNSASDGVVVLRPGGETERYPDWSAMTVALLGAPVPMNDLAFWIRGAARAGVQSSVERDAQGRVRVLRQEAWEIVYDYVGDAPSAHPSRVLLKYPDVEPIEVRVVIDRWNAASP